MGSLLNRLVIFVSHAYSKAKVPLMGKSKSEVLAAEAELGKILGPGLSEK